MTGHVLHMAAMGLLVSVVAPVLVVALTRAAPWLDRATLPAGVVLPGFVVLHGADTLGAAVPHVVLLAGAMLCWAPVLGVRRRLSDAGRMLYLFTAVPLLDLAAVWLVATGDEPGGLAMIVGMLPMGLAAVAITWRWIVREDAQLGVAA